jgi:hypothetical protein
MKVACCDRRSIIKLLYEREGRAEEKEWAAYFWATTHPLSPIHRGCCITVLLSFDAVFKIVVQFA